MGFLSDLNKAFWTMPPKVVASIKSSDGKTTFILHEDDVQKKEGLNYETKPLEGTVARIESGSELESRVTVTRLVALGVFAFALKKKKGGEKYVTIEGDDFVWAIEVDRKQSKEAFIFITTYNNQVKQQKPLS